MKLKKGTLLFLLLTCLAYTTLAQEVGYELKNTDVDIDDNGKITNYKSSNTNIIIPIKIGDITITEIGSDVFKQKNLVAVAFAADSEVTTIGASAFQNNQITALTLPTTLASIGADAFSGNTGLTITLPEHAKGADVTYKDSNNQVYDPNDENKNTFTNFDRSLAIVIPPFYTLKEGDVTVDDQGIITVCLRCKDFVSKRILIPVQIGDITITGIGNEAFRNKNLVAVAFAADSEVTTIGSRAFYGNQITTLTLPASLETIGYYAFFTNKITELPFPEGSQLTTIEGYAFQSNQITTLTLPASLKTIGEDAFAALPITTLTIPDGSQLTAIGDFAFWSNQITTLSLPKGLTTIGEGAFDNNQITELTIPNDAQLTTIGKEAFVGNEDDGGNKITTLSLPTTLTTIGESAFQNNQITTLTFPENAQLTTIGKEAFWGNQLTTLSLPPSLETIGESTFLNNSLTTVTFDDDPNKSRIKSIGINAFSENTGLTGITLPKHAGGDDVKYKDSEGNDYDPNDGNKNTFTNFTISLVAVIPTHTLTADDVTVENGIITKCHCTFVSNKIIIPVEIGGITITGIVDKTSPDKGVFQEKNLVAVAFEGESQVISIGEQAFRSNQITTLTLPTALTTIEGYAFRGNQIATLTLPTALTTIGDYVFYDNQITELTFPENSKLTTIGESAFRQNQITELTFPEDSQLATIGRSAFYLNQITTLDLPTALTSIGIDAFSSNPLPSFILPSVTIEGFRTYWKGGSSADLGTNLTILKADFTKSFERISIQQFSLTTLVEGQQGGTIAPLIDPNGKVYDIETEVSLTATPDQGWRFDKWVITGGGDNNDNPITVTVVDVDVTVDADKTATAHFVQLVTLTVKVNNEDGGSIAPSDDRFVIDKADAPSTQALTAKPNDGWRFDKWVVGSEERTDKTTTITLNQDKTVTAHFVQLVTLTVEVNNEDGGSIAPSDDRFVIDKADAPSTQELTATPNEGWRFDKWVIGSEERTDKTTTITLNQDKTVTAHFVQLVTLTTAVAEQQGGTIAQSVKPNNDGEYDIKTEVTLTATPADGWKFDKWVIGTEERTDNPTSINLDGNKSATAHFVQLVTLTTSVEGQQGGSISRSPDMDTYNINTEVSLTATPADGWKFDKWVIGTEERTDNPTNINLDGNKSATAHFVEIVTLTVEVNNEEGGSIEPSDDRFVIDKADAPSTQALTAKPNEGWRFDKWVIGSEDITENPTTITLDQDKTATAHFVEIVTLTVEVNNEDGGSIEPSDDRFVIDKADPPSTQALTAKPNDGWRFDKWVIGTDEITENPTTITLDKNKSVTAHFVKEEEEEAITSILTEVVSATPYPNPVTSQITLKAKDGDLIQLFSPKGKQQYSAQHTGNEVHIIDVSTLPVGVYLVRITDAEGNTTTKRIVKK